MHWKITTLIENHPDPDGQYAAEHGLSLLIEGTQKERPVRLLMDTGQSGAFYDNAKKMGISLKGLDGVVISHAHYDHSGGFMRFLDEEGNPPVLYVGENFFYRKYYLKKDGTLRYVGTQFTKEDLVKRQVPVCEVTQDSLEIAPGLTLHRNFRQEAEFEKLNPRFLVEKVPGKTQTDIFEEETALALDTGEGMVVIAGCSHPGIVSMLKTIEKRTGREISGVIGGTHLVEADEARLTRTMNSFREMGVNFVGVSHCTGDGNIRKIQEEFGGQFIFNCTGNVISI